MVNLASNAESWKGYPFRQHLLVELIAIAIGICCLIATQWKDWERFDYIFSIAVGLGLFESFRSLLFYICNIPVRFHMQFWLVLEIAGVCVIAIVYFFGSLTVMQDSGFDEDELVLTYLIAGVLGFAASAVYGYSGFMRFAFMTRGASK